MKPKKSPKADLNRNRVLFFQIGIVVALMLTAGLFAWSQNEKTVEKIDLGLGPVEQDMILPAIPEQKPQDMSVAPIQVSAEIINIVDNNTRTPIGLDFPQFDPEAPVIIPKITREPETKDPDFFVVVEQMPKFQGGDEANFRKWVMSRLIYPESAARNGIEGKVIISFVIEKDGSLSNIEVLASPDRSLTEEAQRVLQMSPSWEPGRQRNTPVRVKFNIPVDFKLN